MRSEWSSKTVAELQRDGVLLVEDGNHGNNRPRPDEFADAGVVFIRAADMDGGRVLFESAQCINEAGRNRVRKGIGAGGDVLLSHKGTVGKVASVPLDAPDFVCSPQTTFWRTLDENKLDHVYLFQYMKSKPFQDQLVAFAGETDMAGYVSLTNQRKLQVLLPPPEEQRAIAGVLGALDDKIELNRRMNGTLESMARALFKSWFVDFAPVHANAASQPILPRDLAALFPAEFESSTLGDIPKGWEVKPIGDAVDCVGGGTPSTRQPDYWEDGTHHWATPKDLSDLQSPLLIDTARKLTDAGIGKISSGMLDPGAVLLSSRAPVGYLAIAAIPVGVNQGFIALKPTHDLPSAYLLHWCATNMDTIKGQASGTTFPEISKKAFRPIPMLIPPRRLTAAFTKDVDPLYDRMLANMQESRTLAVLRDALLPRLLQGELRLLGLPTAKD